MKKTYNIIIYVLIGLIVIISIILLIPNKEEKELIVLNLKTKNLEIDQSKNKKIDLDTNGNPSYRSLNTLVAIVTKDGIVLGMASGETKIEISVNNETKDNTLKESEKISSTFDQFSFTKEVLNDYLYCLYLLETGISIQNLVSNLNQSVFGFPLYIYFSKLK